ncbi:MAG: endosialidase [Lachnospiraceae bacterium]|nr:endosialidase [Lachnospiraceae bacterium]
MSAVQELIKNEENGALSFGNHTLAAKAKKEDFEHKGDLYKVKTFNEITKLEKNGLFVYESVPGTSVNDFEETADGITCLVEGDKDAQITLGLADDSEYEVFVGGNSVGRMKTNLGGKLSLSMELEGEGEVELKVKKI